MLTELERDALAELGNIGIGKASTALGRMLGGLVALSVPSVEMVPPADVAALLAQALLDRALLDAAPLDPTLAGRTPADPPATLVGISERLGGLFAGCALLVVPQDGSLALVRAALPADVPAEDAPALEDEVLAELGNVVLNSALAQVANLLGGAIDTGLPALHRGTAAAILRTAGDASAAVAVAAAGAAAVLFHIDLRVEADGGTVRGRVVLLLDAASAGALKAALGRYIGRVVG